MFKLEYSKVAQKKKKDGSERLLAFLTADGDCSHEVCCFFFICSEFCHTLK